MGAHRVKAHYGLGAASVQIGGTPYPHPPKPHFFEDLQELRADLHAQGHSLRRSFAVLPAIMLWLAVTGTFFVTLFSDHADDTGVVVATFTTEPPVAEPVVEPPPQAEPIPEPKLAEIAKPPEPAPVKPAPPPPTRAVAQRPAPPPPKPKPAARPRPVPVVPAPSPQLAAETTPTERNRRRAPTVPKPVAPAPSVRIDQVALADAAAPVRPSRSARNRPEAAAAQSRPDLAPVARVGTTPRTNAAPSRTERAPRFAAAQSRSAAPVAAPALAGLATAAPADAAPTRRRGAAAPAPAAPTRRAAPGMAVPGVTPVQTAAASGPARTTRRAAPTAQPAATTPRPRVAGLSSPAPSAGAVSTTPAGGRSTTARRSATSPSSSRGAAAPGVAGVPLAALAACSSDRQEDSLKQRVIAAVTTQEKCVSRAGTYRFLETRNLNSFLMQVEQARGRAVGDRCDELRLALECLGGATR